MTVIELPSRRTSPRVFVEAPPDTARRVQRALQALGNLPDEMDLLPGLADLSQALIEIADALDDEPDCDDEIVCTDDLPLFSFAARKK